MSEATEQEIAKVIAEHVTVGYTLGNGGLVDPDTIFTHTLAAAHMVHHRFIEPLKRRAEQAEAERDRMREALTRLDDMIFRDPQVIERAGDMRKVISDALSGDASPPSAQTSALETRG